MVIFKSETQPWGGTHPQSETSSLCLLMTLWRYIWMCPAALGTEGDLWQQATAFLWQGEPQRCWETKPLSPSSRDLHKEGGEATVKHTLPLSVWVPLCPHGVHLQGTQNVPPEEMGREALRSRKVLLALRLLNTVQCSTGCRFWQSQGKIWMNAEFQEWFDWEQHLQVKEILYKLQQVCVFLPYKPHYKALVPSKLL